MSETDDADDIEEIRKQKAEALKQTATSPEEPVHVESEDHFEEILADHSPVLVDFYADWCGPCQMLEPTVETVAADTAATVAKVDIDQHQGLAEAFQVQGVPTLYLFVDGEPTDQLVGLHDEDTIRELVAAGA